MRTTKECTFSSWDGTALFYRAWLADKPTDKAIILFHRGHEHSGRWQDVVDKLNLPDFSLFAWDARGHGLSPGERGYAENFGVLLQDVDAFVHFISVEYKIPMENIVVLAHSVGSVLASTWVHDYAPPIRALVLGSPALRVRLYLPFAIPLLRLLLKVKPVSFVQSYVKAKLLTHDPVKIASYTADKLITRAIAVNILIGLYDAGTRLMRDAGAIQTPTLMLVSGADWVVKQSAQRQFFKGLSSPRKEMHVFPGFFHDTFNEKDNHLPIGKAREFILREFVQPTAIPFLLNAHQVGYTKNEYDCLLKPLSLFSPSGLVFALSRLMLKTVGKLSHGIRIGHATGFDSGTMLDYVYRNQAEGWALLGKMIDRNYLDSIGWKGIRLRKQNLQKMLKQTIEQVHAEGKPLQLLDIATGHGRYVLDTLRQMPAYPVCALLRDYSPLNIESGMALATQMGLTNVTYEQGDAFDKKSLAQIKPTPSIVIVSGLYELFPGNEMISTSLQGLAAGMADDGYLIYTNQPWHPQVVLIARTLTSHRNGQPWVMRRRTQAEMDQLVAAAGFEKMAMAIDEYGIFSVSIARKTAHRH